MEDHEHPQIPGIKPDEMRQPFRVPEHYFEKLPGQIADRISEAREEKPGRVSVAMRFVAACIASALLVGGIWLLNRNDKSVPEKMISYEDVVESNTWYDLDEQMLVEELPAEFWDQLPQDSIDDYLIEQNTDINMIINEL